MELSMSTAYVLLLLVDGPVRSVYLQKISDPVPRQKVHQLRPRSPLSLVRPKHLWWFDDEKSTGDQSMATTTYETHTMYVSAD